MTMIGKEVMGGKLSLTVVTRRFTRWACHTPPYRHPVHRGIHSLLATVLILVSNAGDGGCEDVSDAGYNCHVKTHDLEVSDTGRVTGVVENWCETGYEPQRQTFLTWIETRRNPADDWLVSSRVGVERRPPPPERDVYRLRDGRCQADVEYGVAWHASGEDHNGVPFDTGIKRNLFGVAGLC